MDVDLSIVIATMNNEQTLGKCLKSIYAHGLGLSMEIFVSDNSSGDSTARMIRADFPAVKLLENGGNLGFARANNKAIRLAQGRYVLLLNDDTVILDNAISKMVRFMDENPTCGVGSCKLVYPDGRLQSSKFGYPSLFKEFFHANDWLKPLRKTKIISGLGAWLAGYSSAFECFSSSDQVKEVDDVLGAFFMIRKELIDEIGLLDENYWMCREESDFSYRAKKAGYKVFYNPRQTVIHIGSYTVHRTRVKKVRNYCQNFISANYFYQKHYSVPRQLLLKLIILQAFSLKLIITGLAYLFHTSIRGELKRNMVQYIDAMRKIKVNSTERAL